MDFFASFFGNFSKLVKQKNTLIKTCFLCKVYNIWIYSRHIPQKMPFFTQIQPKLCFKANLSLSVSLPY